MRNCSAAIASATTSATCAGSRTSPAARTTLLAPAAAGPVDGVEHPGVDPHRAEAADLQAAVAVGDGEPFGEPDRGVLGDRVRRRSDLGEEPGGGRSGAEVAVAALQPGRHQQPGGEDVGLDVDVEGEVPVIVVGGIELAAGGDTRVGEEQVDLAEGLPRGGDQFGVAGTRRDVRADADRARRTVAVELRCDPFGPRSVEVGHDDPRPGTVEAPGERRTDAAGAPRDHDVSTLELHRWHGR